MSATARRSRLKGVALRLYRQTAVVVPLSLLLGMLVLWMANPQLIRQAQLLVFDAYQRAAPRLYEPMDVRIIDLDDESLKRLGQWPWPRIQVAAMVDRLNALGAAAIGFDIVFSEPDRTSPQAMLDLWRKTSGRDDLDKSLADLPDHDAALARSLRDATVVTGFILTEEGDSAALPKPKAGFSHAGDDPRRILPSDFVSAVTNLPLLDQAAAGSGSFNFTPSVDGVVRRVPLLLRVGEQLYPTLVAELLRVAQGARSYLVKATGASGEQAYGGRAGLTAIKIGRLEVPTDSEGQLWLRFIDPRHTGARVLPAWKLFEPDVDPALIAGHIVLVGTSAAGLLDLRTTPVSPAVAGVSVHAEALEQILSGIHLQRPDWADSAELLFMLGLSLLLVAILPRLGAAWSAVLAGLAVAAAVGGSLYGFSAYGLLVDPLFPSAAVMVVYLSATTTGYLRTESERRHVREAFGHYLAPALVSQLAEHPERLKLGGETKEMTLLFCDVRGFTSISELYKADPQGLTRLINRLLTPLTDVILARQGTIDKYMGDCIMAFWNAPLDVPDHAARACEAALAMFEALEALDAERQQEAAAAGTPYLPLKIGIGLNTGTCVVGNMGSDQRFDYSVLGDSVNLASRLEGQSKNYGVGVVIGETTAAQAQHRFALLELDRIAVKGKKEAVRIFTVYGDRERRDDPAFARLKETHDTLLAAYRRQDWEVAQDALARCQEQADPAIAGFYALYQERIAEFRAAPPGAGWDGVYRATSK